MTRMEWAAFALAGFPLLLHLLATLSPESSADGLAMHLVIPDWIAFHHAWAPPPLQTFESVGFASVIMDEVLHSDWRHAARCARAAPLPLAGSKRWRAASVLAA